LSIFLDVEGLKSGKESLIEVVYHEIFHCVLIAEGRHSLLDYQNSVIKRKKIDATYNADHGLFFN
jgi:hypothetical protein